MKNKVTADSQHSFPCGRWTVSAVTELIKDCGTIFFFNFADLGDI